MVEMLEVELYKGIHEVYANWRVSVVEFPIDVKCLTKQSLEDSF